MFVLKVQSPVEHFLKVITRVDFFLQRSLTFCHFIFETYKPSKEKFLWEAKEIGNK